MSSNYQIHNLALEEASEGRTSGRGIRNISRSQSSKNSSLRQSTTPKSNNIFSSPQRNNYAQQDFNNLSSKAGVSDFRSSPNAQYPSSITPPNDNPGNNNLTVDFLLAKVDDLLKQSQTPVKPQFNQQARQEAPSYSQANPLGQNSTSSSVRQSITLEGKPRKNEIFVKKSYEVPRDSKSLMTNPAKDLQAPRSVENKNELFPIRESMRNSTLSIGVTRSPNREDIQSDMGDIRSRLNNLENQLNAVGSSRYNNSAYNDPYVTPRSQSIPLLRTDSLYSAPPAQHQYETIKKSPYTGEDHLSYSVEKPNNRPAYIETNPKLDAEVSEQICQTIDHLIQTHLLDNRSPSKSTLLSQRTYTSPTKSYNPSTTAPLYKSSILPKDTATEPFHKSLPPQPSSSSYNYQPSTYEPNYPTYSVYESRYDTTLPKYEPYRPYEPLQSYETRSAYEPYETRRYDAVPSYNRDLGSSPSYTSSYNQRTLTAGDYDGSLSSRTRQKYVRPLHRNSPPRYGGDYQNNWSASGSKYISPRSQNDYFNNKHTSGLSTPKRENPYSHQDTSSTDRKMKKLTLKSKVSEEKDYERMELPRQNYARKGIQRQSFKSSDLLPDHDDNERLAYGKNKQSFKSGELMHDNEGYESDNDHQNKTSQKKVRAVPTQAQAPQRTVSQKNNAKKIKGLRGYKAGELEADDDHNAGGLFDDHTPRATANANDAVGELVDDSEGEEWEEEREVDLAQEREKERERVREKAKEYEREKERERVREQERQRLRQSQKVTRNVDDDGKAWNMVHKVPNSMFENAENSFDFDVTEPKQNQRHDNEENRKHVVRASNTVKPKSSLQQQPRKDSGKAMIWAMEEPLARSQRQSMSDLSDSIRRTEKKPVISHVFEKSGRHAY